MTKRIQIEPPVDANLLIYHQETPPLNNNCLVTRAERLRAQPV